MKTNANNKMEEKDLFVWLHFNTLENETYAIRMICEVLLLQKIFKFEEKCP